MSFLKNPDIYNKNDDMKLILRLLGSILLLCIISCGIITINHLNDKIERLETKVILQECRYQSLSLKNNESEKIMLNE